MIETTDGGLSWLEATSPSNNFLSSVRAVRNGNGWVEYIAGNNCTILCRAFSPLAEKLWSWTGAVDSSWSTPGNWVPSTLPLPGDSVVIPDAERSPIIDRWAEQVVIGALTILPGGRLTVTDSISKLVVLGDVQIGGSLQIQPTARVYVVVGGRWQVGSLSSPAKPSGSDRGNFSPGSSTIWLKGRTSVESAFYSLVIDTSAAVISSGNIEIRGNLFCLQDLDLRPQDTLKITNDDPAAIEGAGKITAGTVTRRVSPDASMPYSFESKETRIGFSSSPPHWVSITTYPGTSPDTFGDRWLEVRSRVDNQHRVVIADTVDEFSRWSIKIPRPSPSTTNAAVNRVYSISSEGGGPFLANLYLRYDIREVPGGMVEDSLRLFRMSTPSYIGLRSPNAPNAFALLQNYPNPFNSTATIRYSIPKNIHVILSVYNTLGQKVLDLVNAEVGAGSHDVNLDATNLASGIYWYRIQAGAFILTRKLILLK